MEIERHIEINENYLKYFKDCLYDSIQNKNPKVLKAKLIELKINFLDKENKNLNEWKKLTKTQKPSYESQRAFLENNIAEYKRKIKTTQAAASGHRRV